MQQQHRLSNARKVRGQYKVKLALIPSLNVLRQSLHGWNFGPSFAELDGIYTQCASLVFADLSELRTVLR